jgi:hypothetical protein
VTEQEAQSIVRATELNWRMDMQAEGRAMWRDLLIEYSHSEGTEALFRMTQSMTERPVLAHMRETLLIVRKLQRERVKQLDAPAARVEAPEWVHVWSFARFKLGDHRVFAQQNPADGKHMSGDEYDDLRKQWVQAGSPKITLASLTSSM